MFGAPLSPVLGPSAAALEMQKVNVCFQEEKIKCLFLLLGYHCLSVCNNSSVCVVFRKMFVAMEIEGAFSPRYKCWDRAEGKHGLEEQHQCLPWIWDLCWSDPWRAQPWLCVSAGDPSVPPELPIAAGAGGQQGQLLLPQAAQQELRV